jgi:hypothetical protein
MFGGCLHGKFMSKGIVYLSPHRGCNATVVIPGNERFTPERSKPTRQAMIVPVDPVADLRKFGRMIAPAKDCASKSEIRPSHEDRSDMFGIRGAKCGPQLDRIQCICRWESGG